QDFERLVVTAEQLGNRAPVDRVPLVLDAVDLDPVLLEAFELPQTVNACGYLFGDPDEDPGLFDRGPGRPLDLMQDEDVGGGLDEVHYVVQPGRESMDVFAIERSDESCVELADDVVGEVVTEVLFL